MSLPTPTEIEAARTPQGGWTRETLERWGIEWPPRKGWKRALTKCHGGLHPIERPCPKCGAEQGQPCVGKGRRERKAFHRERGSRRAHMIFHMRADEVESPIEALLAGALLGWIDHHDAAAKLTTQVSVGPYRADIMIEAAGCKLIVECDGAAYHNTPEAIQRDKRRDRYFVTQGIAVMRFTGKEIQADPRGCAAEVGVWIRSRR